MKISSNLNAEKERKKVRHWGWASIASLVGTMSATILYLKQQYEQFIHTPDYSDLRNELFSEVYTKYGCDNKKEFDAFINANSQIIEETFTINGKDMVFTRTEYNELAQPAIDEYWNTHDIFMNIINNSTVDTLDINYEPIIVLLTIPSIITCVYLYKRHQCKKIDNAIKEISKLEEQMLIRK